MSNSIFDFNSSGSQSWSQLKGSSISLAISDYISDQSLPAVVICKDDFTASEVAKEIAFFQGLSESDYLFYPDTETLPYDQQSPHGKIVSSRNAVISSLLNDTKSSRLIVCSVSSVVRKLPSAEHWARSIIGFCVGYKISQSDFIDALVRLNYEKFEYEIKNYGEFASRCDIVDVFPMGFNDAIRVVFENNSVKTISILDVNSGMSEEPFTGSLSILPAKEFTVSYKSIELFKRNFLSYFKKGVGDKVYDAVKNEELPNGIEFLMPFFTEETSHFLEFIKHSDTTVFTIGDIFGKAEDYWSQINDRYADLSLDTEARIIPPEKLWLTVDEIKDLILDFDIIKINDSHESVHTDFEILENGVTRQKNIGDAVSNISEALEQADRSAIFINSEERLSQVKLFCDMAGYEPVQASSWEDFCNRNEDLCIITSSVDSGFIYPKMKISIITEKEIFGRTLYSKDSRQESEIIYDENDFLHLKKGDYISHIEYGICKYQGLESIELGGKKNVLFVAEFAEGAKKFIQLDELFYVNRHDVPDGKEVKLSDLRKVTDAFFYNDNNFLRNKGSGTGKPSKWQSNINSASDQVSRTAETLIQSRAANAARKGIKFPAPDHRYIKFCREFPYRETRDQISATNDIINDMTSTKVMDRTIIADVGFGKTEIANRAIFLAVAGGYQACLLAPTTLLARQHYENLLIRFSETGFKIACLSRELSTLEEKKLLLSISRGEIDIIIGTHKVFQSSVAYKNLGLLVIDEEHRFGVKDKERLKVRRANLDTLYLTATPIPRTLSMALNGIKDMSVVKTPPAKRLSIRTLIRENSPLVIKEAVSREVMRKGQVFVLHNVIETIAQRAEDIKKIMPEVSVRYAHGQMKEQELSAIMADFYAHKFDVLVSTTLIENGIDVPNANTIIIDAADNLGVAQLHQLRGRVGRSSHQAYAYMLKSSEEIPKKSLMRLQALEKASNLGDGLLLANHDLEVRGAGELLGEEQSGQITNIGFQLFMKMLNKAVENIENKNNRDYIERPDFVTMSIGLNTEIEPKYIKYTQARLSYYKRLSSANAMDEIHHIEKELKDKFGPIPEGTRNLISVSKLRFLLKQTGIYKLTAHENGGKVEVSPLNKEAIAKAVRFVNSPQGKEMKCEFTSESVFKYSLKTDDTGRIMSVLNLAKGMNGI